MPHPILQHQLTQDVKLLHKVALISNNKVLILKRSLTAKSRPGKWDLPGGNSEWPVEQSINQINLHQQDLAREVIEETGITIATESFLIDNLAYFATFYEADRQIYSINCGWIINLDQNSGQLPSVLISDEHSEFVWISLSQLDEYDFGGPNRDYETAIIRKALG
jgi:8-oxo-dGTP pyrophosphatase MutT (NUDIX family)